VNFGKNYFFDPILEPLLAPREGETWEFLFSTESGYCQEKEPFIVGSGNQMIGHSALVLKSKPSDRL
jgi:hypothetical protein